MRGRQNENCGGRVKKERNCGSVRRTGVRRAPVEGASVGAPAEGVSGGGWAGGGVCLADETQKQKFHTNTVQKIQKNIKKKKKVDKYTKIKNRNKVENEENKKIPYC